MTTGLAFSCTSALIERRYEVQMRFFHTFVGFGQLRRQSHLQFNKAVFTWSRKGRGPCVGRLTVLADTGR